MHFLGNSGIFMVFPILPSPNQVAKISKNVDQSHLPSHLNSFGIHFMVSLLKSLIVRIWFLFSFLHLNSLSLHCPALFCPEQVGRPLNNSVWALARGTKESRTNREEDLPAGRSASAAARIVLWGRSSVLALQRRTRQEEEVGCQRSGHAGLSASTAAHTQRFQSILTPHSPQSPSSESVSMVWNILL